MRKYNEFLIWTEERSESIEDARTFQTVLGDPEDVMVDFAEYFHDNCDGWEASWPIVFSIATKDGTFLGKFEVERRSEPVFYPRRVE